MKTTYEKYIEIKKQISKLEDEAEALNKKIVADMEDKGLKTLPVGEDKLTIATKLSWIYSGKVTKLDESLKILKVQEQEKGIAKAKESHYLKLSLKK